MNFVRVDRSMQPIFASACLHPAAVLPVVGKIGADARGGSGAQFIGTRVGIGLDKDFRRVAVTDLVFVKRALTQSRDEQFPHAAHPMCRHLVRAPVPAVEVAHHAESFGIRRPAGETHPGHALAHLGAAAEHAIRLLEPAFVEKVQFVGADGGTKTVRIVRFETVPRLARPQPHWQWRRLGSAPDEHTVRMHLVHFHEPGSGRDRYLGGVRPEHAQRPALAVAVQTEHAERVVMARADQCVKVRFGNGGNRCFHKRWRENFDPAMHGIRDCGRRCTYYKGRRLPLPCFFARSQRTVANGTG